MNTDTQLAEEIPEKMLNYVYYRVYSFYKSMALMLSHTFGQQ
jgi:hypothetical protein